MKGRKILLIRLLMVLMCMMISSATAETLNVSHGNREQKMGSAE